MPGGLRHARSRPLVRRRKCRTAEHCRNALPREGATSHQAQYRVVRGCRTSRRMGDGRSYPKRAERDGLPDRGGMEERQSGMGCRRPDCRQEVGPASTGQHRQGTRERHDRISDRQAAAIGATMERRSSAPRPARGGACRREANARAGRTFSRDSSERASMRPSAPHAARRAPWRASAALHVWRLHGDVLR